ncbi:MAG TPA: hypothetical protein VE933_10785 [Chitinophagaceae bacterium]|nr:hypothetical protein [Chitinophagaceae bacterium]
MFRINELVKKPDTGARSYETGFIIFYIGIEDKYLCNATQLKFIVKTIIQQ